MGGVVILAAAPVKGGSVASIAVRGATVGNTDCEVAPTTRPPLWRLRALAIGIAGATGRTTSYVIPPAAIQGDVLLFMPEMLRQVLTSEGWKRTDSIGAYPRAVQNGRSRGPITAWEVDLV